MVVLCTSVQQQHLNNLCLLYKYIHRKQNKNKKFQHQDLKKKMKKSFIAIIRIIVNFFLYGNFFILFHCMMINEEKNYRKNHNECIAAHI